MQFKLKFSRTSFSYCNLSGHKTELPIYRQPDTKLALTQNMASVWESEIVGE